MASNRRGKALGAFSPDRLGPSPAPLPLLISYTYIHTHTPWIYLSTYLPTYLPTGIRVHLVRTHVAVQIAVHVLKQMWTRCTWLPGRASLPSADSRYRRIGVKVDDLLY